MKKKVAPSIYRVQNGVYQYSWYEAGKRKWGTIHTDSIKEVKNVRAKRLIAAEGAGGNSLSQSLKDASLEDIWQMIEDHCRTNNNTPKTIAEYKTHFWRLFRDFPLAKKITFNIHTGLNVVYLNAYLSWYVNEYGAKENPYSETVTIGILLGKLKKVGVMSKDIYEEIKGFTNLQPNEDDTYRQISNTQIEKMFNYMKHDSPSYHDYFSGLCETGRRPMETAKILKGDMEWAGLNNPLRLNIRSSTAKNRRKDQIDLHPTKDIVLKAAIMNAFNRSNLLQSPYLFCNEYGRQISSTDQERYIKKVSQQVLGFTLSARYFRKRYVTLCGIHKVPVKDAMRRSGHRDVEVFVTHYQQPTSDGIGVVIDAIDFHKGGD